MSIEDEATSLIRGLSPMEAFVVVTQENEPVYLRAREILKAWLDEAGEARWDVPVLDRRALAEELEFIANGGEAG